VSPDDLPDERARNARPGSGQPVRDRVARRPLLRAEIEAIAETYESPEAGAAAAVDVAERFVAGDVDYRAAYQVPREEYFERLDEYVGEE